MSDQNASTELDTLPSRLEIAISHATANVPILHPTDTAGAVREGLIGPRFDSVSDLVVCTDGRLVGIVEIEQVLATTADTTVDRLMDQNPLSVGPETDQEIAARVMLDHGEGSLAVVDDNGAFLGLIAPKKMLAVLIQEHDEDLLRFSGLLATGSISRIASEERVTRRLVHRLPWLMLGLIGAMASAWLVGSSEEQLARTVQLAFFLPAIVYMADAVGNQTTTLAVRGLSVGVPIHQFAAKELLAGALIGVFVAASFFPFCLIVFNDLAIATTVSLALLASCGVASVVALLLPWLLTRLRKDPAFGAGPLSTVMQDLLSIASTSRSPPPSLTDRDDVRRKSDCPPVTVPPRQQTSRCLRWSTPADAVRERDRVSITRAVHDPQRGTSRSERRRPVSLKCRWRRGGRDVPKGRPRPERYPACEMRPDPAL